MKRRIPQEAFDYYLGLGVDRSYQLVADKFKVSKNAIVSLADKEHWQERLAKIEREAHQRSEQRAIETIEAMNARHLKTVQVIQGKGLEALKVMPLGSAIDAVRAIDLAMRQERLIRGEPSERTAVSVEDLLKRQYERWMSDEEPVEGDPETSTDNTKTDGMKPETGGETSA